MAGGGQKALLAALTAVLTVAATAAAAQTVPLPTPAPKAGGSPALRPPGSVPQQGATQQGSQQKGSPQGSPQTSAQSGSQQGGGQQSGGQQSQQSGGPSSWLPSIFGGGQQQPQQNEATSSLEPAQRALVDKVSAYLTRVQVMSGDFIQVAPDGRRSKGQFYVQKPGKVRFDYDPPSRIDIIANGTAVVVRDRKLGTQDTYALSQTPLRFLLADRIDLLRDTNVTGVFADDLYVTVVVEEKQVLIGTSKLMMMFGAKDFQLKQWVVTDPQGYDTSVALSNLDIVRRPDPSLFHIDLTQYPN
jgi:outer membrane lipoprotein-sorting protein